MASIKGAMFAAAALVSASAAGARAEALPDGVYHCTMRSGDIRMVFGSIEIRGNTFRMGNHPFKPYQLSDGVILWGGPLEDIEDGTTRVVATRWGGVDMRLTLQTKGAFQEFRTVICGTVE